MPSQSQPDFEARPRRLKRAAFHCLALSFALFATKTTQAAQIGRFSPLSQITSSTSSVTVGNAGYSMDIQKGVFKVNVLTSALTGITGGNDYGAPVYAGAVSMQGASGYWLYDNPGTGYTYSISETQTGFWLGKVVMSVVEPSWAGSLSANMAAGYPSTWYTYQRTSGTGAIRGGLMGYDWAGRIAPLSWSVGTDSSLTAYTRTTGTTLSLPVTTSTGILDAVYTDSAGFTGCLRFNPAPTTLQVTDAGVTWSYGTSTATANLQYLPIAPALPAANMAWIASNFASPLTALSQTFGKDASGNPQVTIAATGNSALLLPAGAGTPNGSVSTVEGTLGIYTGGSSYTATLPAPPQIEALSQTFPALTSTDQTAVNTWVSAVVANQSASGTFAMSAGRGFYDGEICSALALVYPSLPSTLQTSVKASVKKCLDYLWTNMQTCTNWPSYQVAPEQTFFVQTATDYPEIMGFILQATALYCTNIDSTYLATRWTAITTQFSQLRDFDDWSGHQYAHPGPDFYQIIPEGSIGGYLGWHALYHLAQMDGDTTRATEARARAAFAYQAIGQLYPWQSAYGTGVVNGNHNGPLEIFNTSIWADQQYAWFTFLPGFALPSADTYNVWSGLESMPGLSIPWTLYTASTGSGGAGSTQRSYDGANACAFSRAGNYSYFSSYRDALRTRSVTYDAADNSPILMIPAEYWMQQTNPIAGPATLTAATAGTGSVALTWTAPSTGATPSSYTVKYGTASGSYTSSITGITGTTRTVTGLTHGTRYYFAVYGVTASGSGPVSNELNALP